MSYCRFSEADVYVFLSADGTLDCCGCIHGEGSFRAHSTADMVEHLRTHLAAGHYVPDDVIPALLADDVENFPQAAAGSFVLTPEEPAAPDPHVAAGDTTPPGPAQDGEASRGRAASTADWWEEQR